jgi:hypothetical protein
MKYWVSWSFIFFFFFFFILRRENLFKKRSLTIIIFTMNIGTATVIKKVLNPTKLVLFRQEKIKKGSRRSEIDFPDVHLCTMPCSHQIRWLNHVKSDRFFFFFFFFFFKSHNYRRIVFLVIFFLVIFYQDTEQLL